MAKARRDKKGRTLRKGESYRNKQGLYTYAYTDVFGKRCFLYSKDLGELREKEERLKKDQADGLDVYVAGKASLNYLFDRYMSIKTGLRETTRTNYLYNYDSYVRKDFGKRQAAGIRYSDIVLFYRSLVEEKGLSVNTVCGIHTLLHPAFEMAIRDDIIRKNPSDGAMAEINRVYSGTTKKRRALTKEEQKAFLEALKEPKNQRWRPLFVVMLGTGLRIGELAGLRWEDVDMEEGIISVNHAVVYYQPRDKKGKSVMKVTPPKTESGERNVPLLEVVREALAEEKSIQEKTGIRCTEVVDGMTGFIFCNRFGNIHRASVINRNIKRIVDDYNAKEVVSAKKEKRDPILVSHFSNHNLRHTFCARLCERETNLKVIQTIMGHSDITTTMDIYAEVSEQKKKESFGKISDNLEIF